MKKMRTTLFGFALAGLAFIGAGCGGGVSTADLEGVWAADTSAAGAAGLEGTEVEFQDNTMTVRLSYEGQTATLSGGYEETEKGTEKEQGQADFALKFGDFKGTDLNGVESTLTGDDNPFGTVHVKFSEDKKTVTLYEDTIESEDNMKLIKK